MHNFRFEANKIVYTPVITKIKSRYLVHIYHLIMTDDKTEKDATYTYKYLTENEEFCVLRKRYCRDCIQYSGLVISLFLQNHLYHFCHFVFIRFF